MRGHMSVGDVLYMGPDKAGAFIQVLPAFKFNTTSLFVYCHNSGHYKIN